jgi:hypothetical protein
MNKHQNSIAYHGQNKKDFFEGWYFKQVSANEKHSISFIPGVSLSDNDSHAFIQVLYLNEEAELKAYNIRYDLSDFKTTSEPFGVRIKDCYFSKQKVLINIETDEVIIKGEINFGELSPISSTKINPNIMGIFSYIPNMECNHGIVSMDHSLNGSITINNRCIDFDNGKGYIEKDWGTSFPEKYIWLQSNNFDQPKTSIFCSVAKIPFLNFAFQGFICNFVLNGKEYRFATYNLAKIIRNKIDKNTIDLIFKNKENILEIKAEILNSKKLFSPKNGEMKNTIKEGLAGEVKVVLKDSKNNELFNSSGRCAGIEIVS